MSTMDRRILKSQEAIKSSFIELMLEKNFDKITIQEISDKANVGRRTFYDNYMDKYDLLDKITEEHINELKRRCESASHLTFKDANITVFEYLKSNDSFFSTMLVSSAAPSFRSLFLEFVIEELQGEVDTTQGINKGLSKDVILKFLGTAIVGMMETYFTKELPEPPQVIAEQVGILLDRNL
ncbi:TetR family transcriptional regulator [Paenibacillus sp. LMG 31456]|uniref:TetR family transcriptional regulator n=1 Tax=Paenibacillus foliorum TaxID=2654974 RepID=A0A972GQX2_9BACL|nr:TetR/AcrR family transcriptional regulator C-terminal domain-containing protein [Paenibacillus foliorum]NOU92553.1 TetR family transcriptional regulator [Paenibacillus foliorum]